MQFMHIPCFSIFTILSFGLVPCAWQIICNDQVSQHKYLPEVCTDNSSMSSQILGQVVEFYSAIGYSGTRLLGLRRNHQKKKYRKVEMTQQLGIEYSNLSIFFRIQVSSFGQQSTRVPQYSGFLEYSDFGGLGSLQTGTRVSYLVSRADLWYLLTYMQLPVSTFICSDNFLESVQYYQ